MMLNRKKYCSLLLAMLMIFSLTSCEGIGDGALIGDLDGERIVCTVEAYSGDNDLYDSFKMDGTPANELFAYFTETEFEYHPLEGDLMMKPYIVVSFERYSLTGEKLSDVDGESGLRYEYRVFTDNKLMQKLADSQGYQTIAYPDGLYQRLVELFAVRSASNGYFCSIMTDNAWVFIPTAPVKGYELHKLLTDSEYITDLDRTDNEKAYVLVSFIGASDKSYYIYEDDYVEVFDSQSTTSLYQPMGVASGLYAKAKSVFESSLYTLREKDVDASGMWLTRIGVRTKSDKDYTVSDFAPVGCIYVIEEEENYYSLFFHDMNEYYYDQAVEALERREDIVEVVRIYVDE